MLKPTRSVLVVLFTIYLVLLVWIVVWKLSVPWVGGVDRVIKLVPFVASDGAGASQPFEVAMNLVLFVPFGVYLAALMPGWGLGKAATVVACTSVTLEASQFVLAVGSSDLTDVIVNTAGGMAGLGIFALAGRVFHAQRAVLVTWLCSVGTVLALLATAAFASSPLRYGTVGDAGPPLAPEQAVHLRTADRIAR